jgi:hypothetical protein
VATAAELLDAIDQAILDVLQNGQHVAVDGQVYTKADIATLEKMRADYAAITSTGGSSVLDRMKTGVPHR